MKKRMLTIAVAAGLFGAGLLGAASGQVRFEPVVWGNTGLRVDNARDGATFRIVQDGTTKRAIKGVDFEAYLVELTGKGTRELWVRARQADKSWTDYFFTLEGGLRNIGMIDGRASGVTQVEDLDGDGKAEIAMFGTPLTFMVGLDNSKSPFLTNVLGWDELRLADVTARYPKRIRTTILFHYYDFLRAVEQEDDAGQRSAALGYYANSLQIGEGRIAKAWLMRNVPTVELRRWLLDNESRMVNTFYTYPGCRVAVSQTRALPIQIPSCAK
jgi:hypothetical protein